jgi:hypothetical protein
MGWFRPSRRSWFSGEWEAAVRACSLPNGGLCVAGSGTVTTIVAVYGAVLSTIVLIRQFLNERVRVIVTVKRNRQVVGDPRYKNMVLTELTVTNAGHRPVTITTFGTVPLYPNLGLVAAETRPVLPCELTEGRYVTSLWPQAEIDFSVIDYWAAWDSQGRVHKLQEASRLKHWKSIFQLRRSFRKRRDEC